jgi:hypothetical protein
VMRLMQLVGNMETLPVFMLAPVNVVVFLGRVFFF